MSKPDSVRHRDKRVSRGMAAILAVPALFTLGLTVFIGFANAASSKPVPGPALPFVLAGLVALSAMFALLSLTFSVLRTVVTNSELVVKYGLWGPRVAIDRIRSCRVIEYDWTKFGGWGIRRGAGGVWAYVPASGDVVEVTYDDDDGSSRTILVGAQDAPALAREIERARSATGARIALEEDSAQTDDELAALADHEEAPARRKR